MLLPPNREQYAIVNERIRPMLGYLNSLRRRLEQHPGVKLDDEILRAVTEAAGSMHTLSVKLHYKSCPPPNGK